MHGCVWKQWKHEERTKACEPKQKNESITSEPKHMILVFDDLASNYRFEADIMNFLLGRSLVERFKPADKINLVVTCTADCACHHMIKNVYFLKEMWNLKQIRDLAIVNVARFASLNAVFLSSAKNTTAWLYVPMTGHKTIRHILDKNESLRSEAKHMLLGFDDFAPKLLFPSWYYGFLLERNLLQRVDSADQIYLVVTCTADCTCHHLTKNVYIFEGNVKFKTN